LNANWLPIRRRCLRRRFALISCKKRGQAIRSPLRIMPFRGSRTTTGPSNSRWPPPQPKARKARRLPWRELRPTEKSSHSRTADRAATPILLAAAAPQRPTVAAGIPDLMLPAQARQAVPSGVLPRILQAAEAFPVQAARLVPALPEGGARTKSAPHFHHSGPTFWLSRSSRYIAWLLLPLAETERNRSQFLQRDPIRSSRRLDYCQAWLRSFY
jgi:hypothetical protein